MGEKRDNRWGKGRGGREKGGNGVGKCLGRVEWDRKEKGKGKGGNGVGGRGSGEGERG